MSITVEGVAQRAPNVTDASEQAAAQPWVPMQCLQLSAGEYAGRCDVVKLNEQWAVRESQNQTVNKRGATPANLCTLSMACDVAPTMRFSQFDSTSRSQLFLLPGNSEFDVQVPGGIETLYVTFEQDRLLEDLHALNPRRWHSAPRDLQVFLVPRGLGTARSMGELFRFHDMGEGSPVSLRSVQATLKGTLLHAISSATATTTGDSPELHARRRVAHIVSAAREYIEGCLSERHLPTLAEICRVIGVSERVLQRSFREYLGLTPVAYLRIARLHRVRAELSEIPSLGKTVTGVAVAWGFLHLGNFAQDYHRLFAERPSETLRRARFGAEGQRAPIARRASVRNGPLYSSG